MLHWLRWSVASIAMLNLVGMASLAVAYGWHHRLKPRLDRRRRSQRAFERLIARSSLDNHPALTEPSEGVECWEQ
jgi:hypothetical protein